MTRVQRASERARAAANTLPSPSTRSGAASRWVAVGDPQAPLERFLAILDHHGVLDDDGRVADDMLLISIGDHFDYGSARDADKAADDGLSLLAWLASHDEDRVIVIAGNHDLGRVGELATFDDAAFAAIRTEATVVYNGGKPDPIAEHAFIDRYPELPTSEIAARDFAAFCVQQRILVEHLLRQRRLHLGWAADDHTLFVHAGVTAPQLVRLGIDPRDSATSIAAALDRHLAAAVDAWPGPPTRLVIPDVHIPGDAAYGEGDGLLYHRAAREQRPRRYDPRALPPGLVQVIGHIRDGKSRQLLGPDWTDGLEAKNGVLRHLTTDGRVVCYARGLPPTFDRSLATMIFIDGGMAHTEPPDYEVLRSS